VLLVYLHVLRGDSERSVLAMGVMKRRLT